MQDQPSEASDHEVPPTEAQDIRDQGVVLIHVLTRHPTLLTIPDLVREITAGLGGLRGRRRDGARCARSDRRRATHVPERPRSAHSGRPALPEDPLRRQLLGGAGDFGGSGRSQGARLVGLLRPAGIPMPEEPPAKGQPQRPASSNQDPLHRCSQQHRQARLDPVRDEPGSRPEVPQPQPLTPHHSALRKSAPRTPTHYELGPRCV